MNLSKNATNLLGGLVVGVILLAAVLAGALPMLDRTASTNDEADRVAAQNDIQRVQIDALAAKQPELPALQERVGRLQAQMPSTPALESLIRVAEGAAGGPIQLQKIEPGPPADFVPRGEPVTPGDPAAAAPAPAAEGEPTAALQQIPVTIVAGATSVQAAVNYLNTLRAGPRLIGVDSAVVADTESEDFPYTLTLTGRVFVTS